MGEVKIVLVYGLTRLLWILDVILWQYFLEGLFVSSEWKLEAITGL